MTDCGCRPYHLSLSWFGQTQQNIYNINIFFSQVPMLRFVIVTIFGQNLTVFRSYWFGQNNKPRSELRKINKWEYFCHAVYQYRGKMHKGDYVLSIYRKYWQYWITGTIQVPWSYSLIWFVNLDFINPGCHDFTVLIKNIIKPA